MTSLLENINKFDLSGKRFCFDLDDTLCFPNHSATNTNDKYALAVPNLDAIAKLKLYKKRGASIIIYTARRMLTHNGDIRKIVADVGEVTALWLEEHGVPYDDLIFGKPYADFYIDDKAINVTDL